MPPNSRAVVSWSGYAPNFIFIMAVVYNHQMAAQMQENYKIVINITTITHNTNPNPNPKT